MSNNSKIKVSVIIPVYNVATYLAQCLDSIINQTLKDLEIICVNDGSTDNSLSILQKYAQKDPQIRIICQENQGLGSARNNAIPLANGEYIGFIDSDDWVSLNFFEILYQRAQEAAADISATGNVLLVYSNRQKPKDMGFHGEAILSSIPDKGNIIIRAAAVWNKIYRRDFLLQNNFLCSADKIQGEDHVFTTPAVILANHIVTTEQAIYYYRQRENSLANTPKTLKDLGLIGHFQFVLEKLRTFSLSGIEKQQWKSIIHERIYLEFSWFYNQANETLRGALLENLQKSFPEINFDYSNKQSTEFFNSLPITIPIVLAADNNCAHCLAVTMISILENAASTTYYDFFILISNDFSEGNKNIIRSGGQKYPRCQISFINMRDTFDFTRCMIPGISRPTYYRLLTADVLPQKYSACIYLDTDVIVNIDLRSLYRMDLSGFYLAGIRAPTYQNNTKHGHLLKIPSMDQYINAGVLVLNLKKIREDNLTSVFYQEATKNYPFMDQDILNKVCYSHIYFLPFKYNFMPSRVEKRYDTVVKTFGWRDTQEAQSLPAIIHFVDKEKPWQKPFVYFAEYFWHYAMKSTYWHDTVR